MAEENILTLISKKYAETNFIEQGKYTELEKQVRKNTTSISDLGNTVATVKGNVDTLTPKVENIENDVKGNKQAITLLEQDVDKKQDQLTPENAGDNITITGEGSTLKINANGGGGETKAKTWLCTFLDKYSEAGCCFDWLSESEQPAVDNYRVYNFYEGFKAAAIIKFKEAKSMVEVNNWLMHDFKNIYGDNIINYSFPQFRAIAVCVMSDNTDEWPGAN